MGGIVDGSAKKPETHTVDTLAVRIPAPLPCAIAVAVAIALLGRPPAPPPPPGTQADDRVVDQLAGTVGGPVIRTPTGYGAALETRTTTVWMWSEQPIAPGQRVIVRGLVRTPRGFWAPGAPDRADVTASRGAAWEVSVTHLEIVADEPDALDRAWRLAAEIQTQLAARFQATAAGSSGARAALQGIVTGDRTGIPSELDARWGALGIYHVLSVSGLHLAVIAGLVFALLRRLVAASPWGGRTRPARWAAPLALAFAVAYTLITGAQLATLRALLVVTIMLVGQMVDRPVRVLDALGAAALVLLAWRPQHIHDPSFQLSFIAALTLALLPAATPAIGRRARLRQWLTRGLSTSLWVTVTTAPITALHFHQIAAGGVIGNLVLTPVVELFALPLGLAGAVLGPLGGPLVSLGVWLVACVDDVAGVLAHVVPVGQVALGSPRIALVLVTLALALCHRRDRSLVELAGWSIVCAIWLFAPDRPATGALRVTFLDVGQGDAALVETPAGTTILVDAGGLASAGELAAASAPGGVITRALAVYGASAIDLAIVSHPHPDHYLGLAGLALPVHELWFAGEATDRGPRAFGSVVAALARRGTRVGHPALGARVLPDGVTLRVLAPRYDGALAPDPVRTVNDNSLVVAIEYAGRSILFAGDLEVEGETALVTEGLPPVDVVKVAHHGSPTSSSPDFVAATHPHLAVISCGVANAFGFPSPAVIARWLAAGADVARTDRDGTVTVTVDAAGVLAIGRYLGSRL